MKTDIKTIKLGGAAGNCYLIKTTMGFILIVTGGKIKCHDLEKELSQLACTANNLNLIIFIHEKSFNYKNHEYLREKYKAKIAMNILDEALINDPEPKNIWTTTISMLSSVFMITTKSTKFKPDLIIDEGYNLSLFGLNARVLFLPCSSSIGVLTENGELFCDDLLIKNGAKNNYKNPKAANLQKLKKFLIDIIYPSHGKPFHIQALKA